MNLRSRLSQNGVEFGGNLNRTSRDGLEATKLSEPDSMLSGTRQDMGNARATRVNRTHRVVQERAKNIAARRSKIRSLWLPLVIFSTLLVGICIAVWAVLDEYEVAAAGSQVSSYQILVPLFWSVPVSAALLAVVWFRQTRDTGRGPVE